MAMACSTCRLMDGYIQCTCHDLIRYHDSKGSRKKDATLRMRWHLLLYKDEKTYWNASYAKGNYSVLGMDTKQQLSSKSSLRSHLSASSRTPLSQVRSPPSLVTVMVVFELSRACVPQSS